MAQQSGVVAATDVRFEPDSHRYFRDATELASVSSVLRSIMPTDLSGISPEVLANARERGVQVDALFSKFVLGQLDRIPAGTRQDAVALFARLRDWWVAPQEVHAQVLLANDDIAGTCDLIIDCGVWDIKCVHTLRPEYALQLGIYGVLYEEMFGHEPEELGLIHVTERFPRPVIVHLDVEETLTDASLLIACWRMKQRRLKGSR